MDQAVLVRPATPDDLPAILAIYNDAVLNTTAIWNETPVDLDNRIAWFEGRTARNQPVLVAEWDGEVIGYASYGDWRAFEGFRHTMEHSVYVRTDRKGRGTGLRLMEALIIAATGRGVHVLIGCIEAENAASIRLHEKLGFRPVGRFSEVGQKFGHWLDLACMELRLPSQP